MYLLRSFLFIPSDKKHMLDKVVVLRPDAFILDLEDGVNSSNKELARNNIKTLFLTPKISEKIIFVRTSSINSSHIKKDIDYTINNNLHGYIIPKFENYSDLQELLNYISSLEKKKNINSRLKLILMIETSKGLSSIRDTHKISELNKENRIKGIAFGGEDFKEDLSSFSQISDNMFDFARKEIILAAKTANIMAIDTVYRDFMNNQGLKTELEKIVAMGFNSKLTIHPNQIEIVNQAFTPSTELIKKMNLLLKNQEKIKKEGAIAVGKIMYDLPHLKWAIKLKKYIERINSLKN